MNIVILIHSVFMLVMYQLLYNHGSHVVVIYGKLMEMDWNMVEILLYNSKLYYNNTKIITHGFYIMSIMLMLEMDKLKCIHYLKLMDYYLFTLDIDGDQEKTMKLIPTHLELMSNIELK